MKQNELLTYLQAGQSKTIPYNPNIGQVVGSIKSAIFLQQACYWWTVKGGKSFYKFMDKAKHRLYVPTDSWVEELGMGISEFHNARDVVSTKAETVAEVNLLLESDAVEHCIIYYIDSKNGNLTWWTINPKAVGRVLRESIKLDREKEEIKNQFRKTESPLDVLSGPVAETSNDIGEKLLPDTETTTENTSDITSEVGTATETIDLNDFGTVFNVNNEPKAVKDPKNKGKTTKNTKHEKDGIKISCNFGENDGTIAEAIDLGYDEEIVTDELKKFKSYYEDSSLKRKNWLDYFLYTWLQNGYIRGTLKRNGKFYKLDANQERVQSIEQLRSSDMFAEFR